MSPPIGSNSRPEAFGEASKTGLAAINSTVLATCTVVGVALSIYADLASGPLPSVAGYVALVAWFFSLGFTLYLAGRSAGGAGWYQSMVRGLSMARSNVGFTAIVLMLTAGAAFTVWSRAKHEQGSVIASLLGTTARIQADTSVIKAAVTREIPPVEALARQGFTTSADDICRALNARNVEALALMGRAGVTMARLSVPIGGGQFALCIEPLLAEANRPGPDLGELMATLPIDRKDLDRQHVSQLWGSQNPGPIDPTAMLQAMQHRPVPGARLLYFFATPLMFAVWSGNKPAAAALLTAGANSSIGARITVVGSPSIDPAEYQRRWLVLDVPPLFEARRLGHRDIVGLLETAGAQGRVIATDGLQ